MSTTSQFSLDQTVPILSREEIVQAEKYTMNTLNIDSKDLMEFAGKAAFEVFEGFEGAKSVLVVAGPGNNGGDGLVFARHALEAGLDVQVWLVGKDQMNTETSQENLKTYQEMGGSLRCIVDQQSWAQACGQDVDQDWIIDAMFGIGLNRPIEGLYKNVMDGVRLFEKPIFSLDIASGLDANTGKILGVCFESEVTASFSFLKPGFFQNQGIEVSGEVLHIVTQIKSEQEPQSFLLQFEPSAFDGAKTAAHKGEKGHALIFAGSREYSGAAVLSSLSCQKSNVGLTTLAMDESIHDVVKSHLIDVMSYVLSENLEKDFPEVLDRKSAVLIGPGLGATETSQHLLRTLLDHIDVPLVIDASALSFVPLYWDKLAKLDSDVIVTPHPGEMSKLMNKEVGFVQENRFECARTFAMEKNLWVVLKGQMTVIASPEGQVWINPTGDHTLAVGGTGDVLAGLMVSFLAQGHTTLEAITKSVWIHGCIGQMRGHATGGMAVMASDLLPAIESFFKKQ